jgi:hypothetical protein
VSWAHVWRKSVYEFCGELGAQQMPRLRVTAGLIFERRQDEARACTLSLIMFSNSSLAHSPFPTGPCRSVATTLTDNYVGGSLFHW